MAVEATAPVDVGEGGSVGEERALVGQTTNDVPYAAPGGETRGGRWGPRRGGRCRRLGASIGEWGRPSERRALQTTPQT